MTDHAIIVAILAAAMIASWVAFVLEHRARLRAEDRRRGDLKALEFWRGEYERVVASFIGPDPDETRRAAIHRLARKVEAKRSAA